MSPEGQNHPWLKTLPWGLLLYIQSKSAALHSSREYHSLQFCVKLPLTVVQQLYITQKEQLCVAVPWVELHALVVIYNDLEV